MVKIINKKGSSIIEIIVAVGIFTLISASVVVLYLGAFSTNLRDTERLQADMHLQQGFEAARSIRDFDFSNLANGTYGLSSINGYWEFSGSSDTLGQFDRTIVVDDVERDASCTIVAGGGDVDPDSKKVTVTVNWDFEEGNPMSISADQYLNNWVNPSSCGGPGDFIVDVSGVYLSGGNKKVNGITIENTGGTDVVIDTITVSWVNAPNKNKIKKIKIAGNDVWSGNKNSGTVLDITDFTVIAGAGSYLIDEFKFSKIMSGSTLSLTFTMLDTSTVTISNIQL